MLFSIWTLIRASFSLSLSFDKLKLGRTSLPPAVSFLLSIN